MEKLTTSRQYEQTKEEMERLIAEATSKGMLEPEMSNEYTKKIGHLCSLMAAYEDEYMTIFPIAEETRSIQAPSYIQKTTQPLNY